MRNITCVSARPPSPSFPRHQNSVCSRHRGLWRKLLVSCAGVNNFTEYGYYYQTQAMATPSPLPPSNPDPLLIHWTKAEQNPVIPSVPDGGNHSQLRDPTTMWQQVWHKPACTCGTTPCRCTTPCTGHSIEKPFHAADLYGR